MKTKRLKYLWAALFLLAVITACKQNTQQVAVKPETETYYTCSMHPQIHELHPGNCPICAMKLIKAELTAASGAAGSATIKLTSSQLNLAELKPIRWRRKTSEMKKRLPEPSPTTKTRPNN